MAAVAAFAATVLLRAFGELPEDLILAETMMGEALTELGPGSLMVAATAGVAGMLAFERPGGAAVGVAISVTTIPAAAYVGAAMAMGRDDPMWGALVVLVSNVTLLVLASSATLAVQRRSRASYIGAARHRRWPLTCSVRLSEGRPEVGDASEGCRPRMTGHLVRAAVERPAVG